MKPNGRPVMEPEIIVAKIARNLGRAAFEQVKEQADNVVTWEKAKLRKENEAEIIATKARGAQLYDRRNELTEILRYAPSGSPASLRLQRVYYCLVAALMILSSIFLAHMSLAAFGIGWEAWGVSIAVAFIAGFWTERTLEKTKSEQWIKAVCLLALAASVTGLIVLALVRGEVLALYLQTTLSQGGASDAAQNADALAADFYRHAIVKLQLLMGVLAVAMELGTGMALYEARRLDLTSHEAAKKAREELQAVEKEMIAALRQLTHLENEPLIQEADFYSNFYVGMLERLARNVILPILLITTILVHPADSLAQGVATNAGADTMTTVIALDFTQSVAGNGYDGKSEYEKNVEGACRVISRLPPGTHLVVLAITDRSFSQPYLLLRRDIPRDKGPLQFQDRVALGRAGASAELRRVAQSSPTKYKHTDLFGVLIVAAELFKQTPQARHVLVIFSDMRNETAAVNLESPDAIAVDRFLAKAEKNRLLADLPGVEVYILGVDSAGKTVSYWNSLRDFWTQYFHQVGARLHTYSILRELPDSVLVP